MTFFVPSCPDFLSLLQVSLLRVALQREIGGLCPSWQPHSWGAGLLQPLLFSVACVQGCVPPGPLPSAHFIPHLLEMETL